MISKVKKFTLFFLKEEEKLLERLQKLGIVEIESIDIGGFEKEDIVKDDIETKLKQLEFLRNIIDKFGKESTLKKIQVEEKEEKEIIHNFPLETVYLHYYNLYNEVEKRKKIINRAEKLKKEILPFLKTDIIFSEIFKLSNFSFLIFSLPHKKKIEKTNEDLYVEKIGEIKKESLYIILFSKEKKEDVERVIKKADGKILFVRKWNKKTEDILSKLEELEEKNYEKILKLENEISKIINYKKEIFILFDYYKNFYSFLCAKEKIGISKFVKGIKGWIREKDIKILKENIEKIIPESYLIIEEPQEGDNIPIILENRKLIEPFEVVTDLYGRPVYKNIDPTGPLSLFFALSFGFCLTDAGYGLLLIIISSILIKKFKLLQNFVKFLKLLLICGISTFIIGLLTGGWFGDTLYIIPENFGFVRILKKLVILNPLEGGNKATLFLLIALIFGYLQIVWGLVLNLYTHLKNYSLKYCGEAISLLLIQILVAIIVIGFILKINMLVKVSLFVLIFCFIYLMIEKAKTQKEFMLKGFWAIYGAYSVISGNLLGDILSYSRLFGLGLTTSILGLVINQLVLMLKNIPYIGVIFASIIFIFGHLGNLLINLLGSYVHTSRLQYLEFFTKFFEGGGRFFKPFQEERIYTFKVSELKD
ncbi:MAG: hypothetical protein NC915_02245 [Candidatus Omnitrophica bacterium]|nr:hypothetical protein [Candidatus Omnitrophota bacterium]